MHVFHKYEAATVEDIIAKWLDHISKPIPAIVGDREVDDLGPTSLTPAILLCGDKEVRRVGKMVHVEYKTRKPKNMQDVEEYKKALLKDPDITRLLLKQYGAI